MTKLNISPCEDREIDVFVASKIGSLKHIKYHTDKLKNNKKCIENLIDIKSLEKEDSITCMVWGNRDQNEILLGKKNLQIHTYNTTLGFTKSYTADFGTGHIVGLGRYKRKLIAALSDGAVKVWSKKEEYTLDAGKMDCLRMCADDETLFATGGEENDLKVWKIGETTPTFVAKNLSHDWLQLRRPVWVSDLTFLPTEGGRVLATCSRYGYVRLYDTRAQRRPTVNVDFNMAATCIAPSFDERRVLVGFGRGQLHQVDLRNSKPDKGFKGCAGAVSSIATSPGPNRFVFSVSLDRQLRAHHYDTKDLVYRQYLTSKLSCVLVQTEGSTPMKRRDEETEIKEEEEDEKVAVDEVDELFDNMETVGDNARKKKLPPNPTEEAKRSKPSTEGSTIPEKELDEEAAIINLLRSTERQKKKQEKKKKEKKAKSVFHNA